MKLLFGFLLFAVSIFGLSRFAAAESTTWSSNPITGDWNLPTNWSPPGVPNDPSDIATFISTSIPVVFLTDNTEVAAIDFSPGASAYTITAAPPFTLTFAGDGVTNDSGVPQNFVSDGVLGNISFLDSASAGSNTTFTTNSGGLTRFFDTATASNATLISNSGGQVNFFTSSTAENATLIGNGGQINFFGSSNAGTANIQLNGGSLGFTSTASAGSANILLNGATAQFQSATTASNATLTIENGGKLTFQGSSPADNANLIVNDGSVNIVGVSNGGGMAALQLADAGSVSVQLQVTGTAAFGSLSGSGKIQLGPNEIQVGRNNLSTTFSGSIAGSPHAGSVVKTGTGVLTLSGQSTYDADTTVSGGVLLLNNRKGSATGGGLVSILGSTTILGGNGRASGGAILDLGATLEPSWGSSRRVRLDLGQSLTFQPNSIYNVIIDSRRGTADKVSALNVTIYGAQFALTDVSNSPLPSGTVFIVISTTSTTPISGQFSNLPDGGTIAAGVNTFQASYSGGDGNDLTLTVQ